MTLTKATKENLRRKSSFIDKVQMIGKIPLFSWVEISTTDLCNRVCTFCPRANSDLYPNQNNHISKKLIKKIADELSAISYKGGVLLCGYGEPLLHPEILEICSLFDKKTRLEIVTNGDKLNEELIRELYATNVNMIVVSMYDGEDQVKHFQNMFNKAGIKKNQYILRDRWHSEADNFGLKLTNRAGTVAWGKQDKVIQNKKCFYPHYSMSIDWNGDALLCVQDWHKKLKFGNVYANNLLDIWSTKHLTKIRRNLANGKRSSAPCDQCNADGTLHGFNHVDKWKL
ncbi:MAG: SPASM domain-containing protein [Rhodospirillales bacterium]|nr:SPASM domain-containing protein [Rhodospirillales bacterium]